MEKHDALKILFQCADQYYEKLCDNTLLIILLSVQIPAETRPLPQRFYSSEPTSYI